MTRPFPLPTISRVVHFRDTTGVLRPAIVFGVDVVEGMRTGVVDLEFFGNHPERLAYRVPYDPKGAPHTWMWPPRE